MEESYSDGGAPRPVIVYTTPILGYPAKGGPELRVLNSLKALGMIADIILVATMPQHTVSAETQAGIRKHVRDLHFAPSLNGRGEAMPKGSSGRRVLDLVLAPWRGSPAVREDAKFVAMLAAREKALAIWMGFGNISYPLLDRLRRISDLPVILDTDSVWSRFILRGIQHHRAPLKRIQAFTTGWTKRMEERRGARLAHITTAVSAVDARYYRSLPGANRVMLFSNVIDLASYEIPERRERTTSVYLAGSFYAPESPMVDAARFLVLEVMPRVWKAAPATSVHLVGRGVTKHLDLPADPRIVRVESPDSVLPWLLRSTVATVPLRFESGTRFKILEAAACRVPIVSTTLGAEGIDVNDGTHVLIADDAETFASAILAIMRDEGMASHLAENAHRLVAAEYAIPKATAEGARILAAARERDRGGRLEAEARRQGVKKA